MSREYKLQGFLKLDRGGWTEHKNLKTDISVYLHFRAPNVIFRKADFFPLKYDFGKKKWTSKAGNTLFLCNKKPSSSCLM